MLSVTACCMTAWFVTQLSVGQCWSPMLLNLAQTWAEFSVVTHYSSVLLLHSSEAHTSVVFYRWALQQQYVLLHVSGCLVKTEKWSIGRGVFVCEHIVPEFLQYVPTNPRPCQLPSEGNNNCMVFFAVLPCCIPSLLTPIFALTKPTLSFLACFFLVFFYHTVCPFFPSFLFNSMIPFFTFFLFSICPSYLILLLNSLPHAISFSFL